MPIQGGSDLTITGSYAMERRFAQGHRLHSHRRRGHDGHPGAGISHGSDGRPLVAQARLDAPVALGRPERDDQHLRRPGRSPAPGVKHLLGVVNNSGTVTDTAVGGVIIPGHSGSIHVQFNNLAGGVFDDQVDGEPLRGGLSQTADGFLQRRHAREVGRDRDGHHYIRP